MNEWWQHVHFGANDSFNESSHYYFNEDIRRGRAVWSEISTFRKPCLPLHQSLLLCDKPISQITELRHRHFTKLQTLHWSKDKYSLSKWHSSLSLHAVRHKSPLRIVSFCLRLLSFSLSFLPRKNGAFFTLFWHFISSTCIFWQSIDVLCGPVMHRGRLTVMGVFMLSMVFACCSPHHREFGSQSARWGQRQWIDSLMKYIDHQSQRNY